MLHKLLLPFLYTGVICGVVRVLGNIPSNKHLLHKEVKIGVITPAVNLMNFIGMPLIGVLLFQFIVPVCNNISCSVIGFKNKE